MPTNSYFSEFPERNWILQSSGAGMRVRSRGAVSPQTATKIGAAIGTYLAKKPRAEANYGVGAREGGVGGAPY